MILFKSLRDETNIMIDNAIHTVYYMRGALNYFDYYDMTYMERQKIAEFLRKRFTDESKKPLTMARVY